MVDLQAALKAKCRVHDETAIWDGSDEMGRCALLEKVWMQWK